MHRMFIGTAGWSIPRSAASAFPEAGSALERYASQFTAAEINSSFYRTHRSSTWSRWGDDTPAGFCFSVKIPKLITHQHGLVRCSGLIDEFLGQTGGLGHKLAVLLVQLPPKLEFQDEVVGAFFEYLGSKTSALIACEPRHVSWFTPAADALLVRHRVARVAADPTVCVAGGKPGGWPGLRYWRLHGTPERYRSSYAARLVDYSERIRKGQKMDGQSWCIFDNTASGAAISDALGLAHLLRTD